MVRSIRSNMPDAVILLVGPGDSIKNKNPTMIPVAVPAKTLLKKSFGVILGVAALLDMRFRPLHGPHQLLLRMDQLR